MLKAFYDVSPYSNFRPHKQPFDGNVRALPIFRGFFLTGYLRDGRFYFRYNRNGAEVEANAFGQGLWDWFSARGCELEEVSLTIEHKVLEEYEILTPILQAITTDQPLRWDDYQYNVYNITGRGKGLSAFRRRALEPKTYWELDEYYSELSEHPKRYRGIWVSAVDAGGFWKHYRREFWWVQTITITAFNRIVGISEGVTDDGKIFRLVLKRNDNWTLDHFQKRSSKEIIGSKITVAYQAPSVHPYYRAGEEYEILTVTNSRLATAEELEHTRIKRGLRDLDAALRKGILIYEGN